MNLKPTSINPTVTHRVQRFGFIKAVAISSLFTTGALTFTALAYNPQLTEYKLSVPVHAPAQNAVAAMDLQENTGTAVVRLDGFTLDVNFKYNTIEDDYGVPGSDFMNAEILDLAVDQAYDNSGNKISDFTDFNDHLTINAMLVAHMLQNRMLEGV